MRQNYEAPDLQSRLSQILANINVEVQRVADLRFYMRLHCFIQENDTLQNALVDLRSLYQYGKEYLEVSDEFLEAVVEQCFLNRDLLFLEHHESQVPNFLSLWTPPARLREGLNERLNANRL